MTAKNMDSKLVVHSTEKKFCREKNEQTLTKENMKKIHKF